MADIFEIINEEKDHEYLLLNNNICEIKRHERYYTLNGYVYLPKRHKLWKQDYNSIDVDVHGGLTYSNRHGAYWVIGFDCNHAGDLMPKYIEIPAIDFSDDVYRTWDYVLNQLDDLTKQLNQIYYTKIPPDEFAKFLLYNKA